MRFSACAPPPAKSTNQFLWFPLKQPVSRYPQAKTAMSSASQRKDPHKSFGRCLQLPLGNPFCQAENTSMQTGSKGHQWGWKCCPNNKETSLAPVWQQTHWPSGQDVGGNDHEPQRRGVEAAAASEAHGEPPLLRHACVDKVGFRLV